MAATVLCKRANEISNGFVTEQTILFIHLHRAEFIGAVGEHALAAVLARTTGLVLLAESSAESKGEHALTLSGGHQQFLRRSSAGHGLR